MQQILVISVTKAIFLLAYSEIITVHCDSSAKYLGTFWAECMVFQH